MLILSNADLEGAFYFSVFSAPYSFVDDQGTKLVATGGMRLFL